MKFIMTNNDYTRMKSSLKILDTMYGFIVGGDPQNTWGCMEGPNSNDCASGK